jgi:hypothetical protein
LKDDYPDSNIVAIDYDPARPNQSGKTHKAHDFKRGPDIDADVRTMGQNMEDTVCNIGASSSSAAPAAAKQPSH